VIKTGLSQLYPNLKIDSQILEYDNDGVIYEWSAKKDSTEKIHGWGRAFSDKEGTVVLGYQTENIPDVAKMRSIWLPVIKEAHYKKK
jgi:hypothetical protein